MNDFEVVKELNVIDYLACVQDIADMYFTEDGEYQPHIGRINAIAAYYKYFVTKGKYDELFAGKTADILALQPLLEDDDYLTKYNNAVKETDTLKQLTFYSAFQDAMEIVNVRKTSFGNAVSIVEKLIRNLITKIAPALTEENIKNVSAIAKDMANGKNSAESVVDVYMNKMTEQEEG